MADHPLVTLLTDFGDRDYYVGAVRGTILRLAPRARLVDLGHSVEPGNIAEGAFLLAAAAPSFPPAAIHLAVVDPGVGSNRRILAASGDGHYFVGPDNGLLLRRLDACQSAELRAVTRDDLFLAGPGSTFHGRDRFAPVAAYLARSGPLAELGPLVDDPVRLDDEPPKRRRNGLVGRVVHVDRFGNLVTDLPSDWLDDRPLTVRAGQLRTQRTCSHYEQIPRGEAALVPGSLGTLELSMRGESAARTWSIAAGERVQVDFG